MAKFATNAGGAMLLLNLIQVTESISGSVVPLAMFIIILLEPQVLFLAEVCQKIHPSQSHPPVAFEHLILYLQKHLSQSVTVCGAAGPLVDHS